jgi:hypothetical protein
LLITHINDGHNMKDFLTVTGMLSAIDERHLFHDADEALEWAEDRIISELCYMDEHRRYPLPELEVVNNFSDGELEAFKQYLDLKTFKIDHPQIALKFVSNIAWVISQRLRVRSQEIRMLVDK